MYDIFAQQETLLEIRLPEAAAVVMFVIKGEILLKTKPLHTAMLPENSYSLAAMQPGQHALEASPGHCRIFFFQLGPSLRSLVDVAHVHLPLPSRPINGTCRQLLSSICQGRLNGEVWQLRRQVIVLDLLFKTLDEAGVHYKQQQESAYHRNYDTFKQVKAYVQDNAHKKLSVQTLATRFAIQPTLLRRGYKKVFHHHLCDYIREVRLDRARNLLQNTRLPVHEIAWEVGYESSTSFTRVFTAYYQQSPTDYRRNVLRPAT